MIIALDGPAGVGKSTIAKTIAEKLNFFFLNSGNFYRCVSLEVLNKNINHFEKDKVIDVAKKINISIIDKRLFLNNEFIENSLHTDEIDGIVASISSIVEVRNTINEKMRLLFDKIDFVCEGRDMTTEVFPKAEVKIFLDATPEERAKRRFDQGVSDLSYDEILNSIKNRDYIDRNKVIGSLRIADDALVIDTTELTLNEVLDKILKIYRNRSNE